ncbi:hypothetical protein JTB14_013426 [Gonioctena quinquepunctata]|nr:hypothetical protein JTB14_013426 [Gonioctena quinquepunctata]
MASSSRKRSRIPVEEVSDNDYDSEEKTVIVRRNLKDTIMRMYDRGGGNDEQFRRLPFTANSGYKSPSQHTRKKIGILSVFLLIICYKKHNKH